MNKRMGETICELENGERDSASGNSCLYVPNQLWAILPWKLVVIAYDNSITSPTPSIIT